MAVFILQLSWLVATVARLVLVVSRTTSFH
jgi:hypothetical protein